MYASGLTWKRSYHNEGAKISILFTIFALLTITRQVHQVVVGGNISVIMYDIRNA